MPLLVTDPAFQDVIEKRYFQYFRQASVASNNSLIDSRFWDRLVLQACHTEPAIRHAVLALSALHQLDQLPRGSDMATQHETYAARQHQKALAAAQQLVATSSSQPHDFDRILTACVIFIMFDSVRGDYVAAATHMSSGRAILGQHAAKLNHPARRKDLTEIEHAMARLDLAALFFQDATTPYAFSVKDFHKTCPVIVAHTFRDIQEAQTCLIDLCRWLLITAEHVERVEECDLLAKARYEAETVRCSAELERFDEQFRHLLERTDQVPEAVVLNLKCWFTFATLAIRAGDYPSETRWDAYLSDFETIVALAEDIASRIQSSTPSSMFSYEIGYLAPLYAAATRCRDPCIRRRAIAVLRDYPRQEGVLESRAAATIAAAGMRAEEDGLDVKYASDIPEDRRLIAMDIRVDVQNKEATIKLTQQSHTLKTDMLVRWE